MNFTGLVTFISQALGAIALLMLLTLNPRVRPLPVAFRFPRSEALVALGVAAGVMLLRFIPRWQAHSAFLLPAPGDITRGELNELPVRLLVTWVALLVVGLLLAFTKSEKPLVSVGWNARDLRSSFRLGLAMGLLALFLSGRVWLLFTGFHFTDFYALLVWLGIALCEETVFRGFLQTRLSAWMGKNTGWLLASLVFLLWALPSFIGQPDFALQALVFLGRGLLHGWIFRKSGHVLTATLFSAFSQWALYI